ncbi:hypothetical protein Emed_007666 [Eimeria media]
MTGPAPPLLPLGAGPPTSGSSGPLPFGFPACVADPSVTSGEDRDLGLLRPAESRSDGVAVDWRGPLTAPPGRSQYVATQDRVTGASAGTSAAKAARVLHDSV